MDGSTVCDGIPHLAENAQSDEVIFFFFRLHMKTK